MTATPTKSGGDLDTCLSAGEQSGDNGVQKDDSGLEATAHSQVVRVPHPIFAIVNPPKVSSMAREALVEWLKLRKEYEEQTKDRCKDGKEDVNAVMKSVKSAFDANVLETLCDVCLGVEQTSVIDDFLLEKIHEITDSFQNQELPDVRERFREELRMNTANTDIDARVIEYFHLCNSLIKKHGFSSFSEEERGSKEKCKLIVSSLPKGPKNKVQNELDFRVPEAKSDIRKLYELVRVKAKEQAIEERALKRANLSRHKNEKKTHNTNPTQNKRHNEVQDQRVVKKAKPGKYDNRSQTKSDKSGRAGPQGAPKEGCFHCGEAHYLSNCPTATPSEREKLLADRKKDRKAAESPGKGRHR